MKLLVAGLAALGLAASATSAMAQKAEPSKDAAKKSQAAAKDATKKAAAPAPAAAPTGDLMDINSASEAELASLKGIGEVRSKAIVKGRPYKGKDDLVKRKIVPQNVYDDIKDQIIAKQGTAKPAAKKKG
ncbi:MAG TPA: helix-hairpin-helix domain-containing protein [Usitatibacter sp.]|nr:helix-hairpin-helix domain-containing protein [Usitatibacter sp.]